MIFIIDNYDSFVYNIARYVEELGYTSIVKRNDQAALDDIEIRKPSHIIISPGPCTPNEAGISLAAIEKFTRQVPILGVCLGHQAIGQVFGGTISRAKKPVHGKTSTIKHTGQNIFKNLTNPLVVG